MIKKNSKFYNPKSIVINAVEQNICHPDDNKLILPKSAEVLLPYSFYECPNIQEALIHDNIRVCTKETFHNTEEILLTNPVYKKEDGLMINTHLGIVLYADDNLENVIIPEGIKEISPYSFNGNLMKTIKLPESLERIGMYSFNQCPNLQQIKIPSKVKKLERDTLNNCSSLLEIVLPSGFKAIDICSISDNPKLEKCLFPSSLKRIGNRSFWNCTKLDSHRN